MNRWILLALLGLAVLLLGATACGGQSNSDKASDALTKGLAAHQAGRVEEAAVLYRKVLTYDPRNKYAFYNLGVIDQSADRATQAENNYRLALSVDPDYPPALFNLAILKTAAGATQEAIDLYRHIIQVEPNNAAAHNNLGYALRSIGQQAAGDAEIRLAGQLDSKFSAPAPAPIPPPGQTPVAGPTGSAPR